MYESKAKQSEVEGRRRLRGSIWVDSTVQCCLEMWNPIPTYDHDPSDVSSCLLLPLSCVLAGYPSTTGKPGVSVSPEGARGGGR
jgi:hypothetical protein